MKLSLAFSLFLTAAALNIASGRKYVNPLWHLKCVENVVQASALSGDRKDTYDTKVQLFFDGVKAMCVKPGAIDGLTITQLPDWDLTNYEKDPDTELEKQAKKSWQIFKPILKDCGFKRREIVSWFFNDLFSPAILHVKKTQRDRVESVIDYIIRYTVANEEAYIAKNLECFKDELMVDFKDDETLIEKAGKDATVKVARRLVNLMLRLGQNPIEGKVPMFC